MKKITIGTGRPYEVIIEAGLLPQCGKLTAGVVSAKKAVIVTDDAVGELYGETAMESYKNAGFSVELFTFPRGEQSKSHEVLLNLYNFLAACGVTRSDIIVALGGGVVGDLAGFAAATYQRGIDFIQIPTTLLAQVDSSVGGKTAVNISAGKNLVGAFHQPLLVICDTKTLDTLSDEIFSDGMGEVVKYGAIRSKSLFTKLKNGNVRSDMSEIIAECIRIKADIVRADEFDKGERMLLNFGHTIGHAIEKYCNFGGISHGKAVAVGMAYISKKAEEKGMISAGTASEITACLKMNGLPCSVDIPEQILYEYSLGDKKRSADGISVILAEKIGQSVIKKMTTEEYRDFILG